MPERIHDDEPDVSEPVVRALLGAECPRWATHPLTYLRTSGTDNAMWRIDLEDASAVVRLPRRPAAARHVEHEVRLLRALATTELSTVVRIPTVLHLGDPHDVYPYPWTVFDWIPGVDAWQARHDLIAPQHDLAVDLARAIRAIDDIGTDGVFTDFDVRVRQPGERGGPIAPLLDRLDGWLDDPRWNAPERIDVAAVRRHVAMARELGDEPETPRIVHGDLIPGNLLVDRGRLTAIIDWAGAAWADPAQGLAPAWAVLDADARLTFRDAVGADDATWARARAFELEHAVGGVLYYEPKSHPLGDVMRRTLDRILTESL